MIQRFPARPAEQKENAAIKLFGLRVHSGQTFYEYVVEFFLVLCGTKTYLGPRGHQEAEYEPYVIPGLPADDECRLQYEIKSHLGLKLFLFLLSSKVESRSESDLADYEKVERTLMSRVLSNNPSGDVADLRDLVVGFAAVVQNRGWFAKSMLPVTRDVIFPEAFPKRGTTSQNSYDYNRHNFLARGGEQYFLRLIRALGDKPKLRDEIEVGLKRVTEGYPHLEKVTGWLRQVTDQQDLKASTKYSVTYDIGWIPTTPGYSRRLPYAALELANLLQSSLNPIETMETLGYAIVLDLMRSMHEQATAVLGADQPEWLVQAPSSDDPYIKNKAHESYARAELQIRASLKVQSSDVDKQAFEQSLMPFRRMLKFMGLVVPATGPRPRFTINETLIRTFILLLLRPGQKMLFTTFTEKLREHFGIVFGGSELDSISAELNKDAFSESIRLSGYLRRLSDATAVVENPYVR